MFTPRTYKQEMEVNRVENIKSITTDEYISVEEFEDRYYEEHPIKYNPTITVEGRECIQDADTKQLIYCQ